MLRVIEMSGRLGLETESLQVVRGGEPAGAHHLQREHAVQAHLAGLVDDTHSTLGDDFDELIIAEVADSRFARHALVRVGSAGLNARGDAIAFVFVLRGRARERERSRRRRAGSKSRGKRNSRSPVVRGCTVSERGGQPGDVVLVGEEEASSAARSGCSAVRCSSIDGVARFDRLEISRDDVVQPPVALERADRDSARIECLAIAAMTLPRFSGSRLRPQAP